MTEKKTTALEPLSEIKQDPMVILISELTKTGRIEEAQQIIQMRNDELKRRARDAYDAAFVAMKPELKRIENKHFNDQTKSKFSKLEDINQEIDPVLTKHGFASSTPVVSQDDTSVTVACIITHTDPVYGSHREETLLKMPLDLCGAKGTVNKTGPHALASSIKYARRVALCAALNISTGDGVDNDGNGEKKEEKITIEQAAEIDNRLREMGDGALDGFLKVAKISAIIDLPASKYQAAIRKIETTEKARKEKAKK